MIQALHSFTSQIETTCKIFSILVVVGYYKKLLLCASVHASCNVAITRIKCAKSDKYTQIRCFYVL